MAKKKIGLDNEPIEEEDYVRVLEDLMEDGLLSLVQVDHIKQVVQLGKDKDLKDAVAFFKDHGDEESFRESLVRFSKL